MIEILKTKIEEFQSEDPTLATFNNLPVNALVPNFYCLRDENGYFYYDKRVIAYYNLRDGFIYRLVQNHSISDWDCYTNLFRKGARFGTFRLETPLIKEEIEINNIIWSYMKTKTPDSFIGYSIFDDILYWPQLVDGKTLSEPLSPELVSNIKQYFKNYVDNTMPIIIAAMEIANEKNCGLPSSLAEMPSRFRDRNGYFYSNLITNKWVSALDDIKEQNLFSIEAMLNFSKSYGVIVDADFTEIMNYAREKWTTI